MKRVSYKILSVSLVAILLSACTADTLSEGTAMSREARPNELTGIRAVIEGGAMSATRAGTVTTLVDYVGRSDFKKDDQVLFTEIRRTEGPITEFTYPGNGNYDGIIFQFGSEGGWKRAADNGPERVYWTDAVSTHTFVAYSTPQTADYDWKKYEFTQNETKKTYYIGSLGNPTDNEVIDYTLTADEQNTAEVGGKTIYKNPKLENEDLLIAHDSEMKAEPGGSVALVKFYHGLSSIRVIVNISGFSSTSYDHAAVVSDMKLLHQPTMYVWMQSDKCAQPLRASREGSSVTDQEMVNKAWDNNESNVPAYNQRKDMKLWIPIPAGTGSNQSKIFTFYGITTPQPSDYINTLPSKGEGSEYRSAELEFNVTYADPLKPSTTVTKPYKASLPDVYFEAGYNTTINISLNHKDEKMTVGAEYENWQFIATPDQGELKKNSTFLQDTERSSIYLSGIDEKATIDDATWLYELNNTIYDVYGHKGTQDDPYQISTAYQLLSFAYEVKAGNHGAGRDFKDKYVRLDADLTLQPTSNKYKEEIVSTGDNQQQIDDAASALEWIGIGDASHPFNGTFIGGNRFIHRLKGSPLFASLGEYARVEELQVNAITIGNGNYTSVAGNGLFAESNAGLICASRVVGDVSFSGTEAGAFVGQNTGTLYVCYHVGDTKGSSVTGGLVGSNGNEGIIEGCYHAGAVTGTTTGGITGSNTGTLDNNYYNSTMLTPNFIPDTGVKGCTSTYMTKQAFVTEINNGITTWCTNHAGYDNSYRYVYQPANYPQLQKE